MELPKILVTGKFGPDDLIVSVSESNRKIAPEIESQIDSVWIEMQKEAKKQGKVCYNGISYRLNSLQSKEGKLLLDFGTFEYKVRDGLMNIPGYFDLPEEYWRKGCFTGASVKTSDEKYLMVELSGKSMNHNSIDVLGGIMETNIGMHTGQDIFESLYDELKQEADIAKQDIRDTYLRSIYLTPSTNIAFYFEVTLNVSSEDLLKRFETNKDTDIKSLCVYTREEYINTLKQHISLHKQLITTLLNI